MLYDGTDATDSATRVWGKDPVLPVDPPEGDTVLEVRDYKVWFPIRKGLLKRSERFRSHVYEASQPQSRVQRDLVQSLVRQAFGGSAASLVQSALGGRKVTAAELAEIREVLEKFGGKS